MDVDAVQVRLENGQDTQNDVQDLILYTRELEGAVEGIMASRIDACQLLFRSNYLLGIDTEEHRKLTADIARYLREVGYNGR